MKDLPEKGTFARAVLEYDIHLIEHGLHHVWIVKGTRLSIKQRVFLFVRKLGRAAGIALLWVRWVAHKIKKGV
jgi:hypothetical protein